MTTLRGTNRDFIKEFKAKCDYVDGKPRKPVSLLVQALTRYQVVKVDGDIRKVIFMNVTREDAENHVRRLSSKLLLINEPNTIGLPYFKLESYKVSTLKDEFHL